MIKWLNSLISRRLARHRMKHNHSGMPQRQLWYEKLMNRVNHSRIIGASMMIMLWFVSSFVLILPQLTPREYKLMVNRKAPETIIAEIDFTYEDSARTEELRRAAEAAVQNYYRFSATEKRRIGQEFRKFTDALDARIGLERQNKEYTPADNDEFGVAVAALPPEVVNDLAALYDEELTGAALARNFERIIQRGILSVRDKQSLPAEEKIRLVDEFGREQERLVAELPDGQEAARHFTMELARQNPQISVGRLSEARRPLLAVLEKILANKGNLERMDEQRRQRQLQARQQVQPVMKKVARHQEIVHRGEIVTPRIMEIIDAYNQHYIRQFKVGSYFHMIYVIYWCLLLVIFVMIYLYHIHPKVVQDNGSMMLCIWVIIIGLGLNYLSAKGFYVAWRAWDIPPELIGMALPVGFCAALLAVTVGFRVSLYMGFFVATITAMMIGDEFNNAIGGMLLCGATALAVRNADNYRSFFIRTMLAVIVSFIVMGAAIILLLADSVTWREILWGLGVAAVNGFLTATLALLALFVLEVFFRVSTNMSLLMFDYNHPLLVELRRKAPGTFHHSLTVSTLAEAAAKDIHYNPIPARVAALFHDIGKLGKPVYFAENIPGENKHDELRPRMSSMVIMNHVKAGLTLASKYRLPRIIRKTIEQHHGTDMVYYFYRKAQDARNRGDAVEELEFRYPGPLPCDKTVVLVSLADACEAACRSIKKPTPAKIEQMVCDIFERRIRDGQLDHADITMGELAAVRDCFIRELTSIHHARMAYPREQDEDEDRPFMAAEKPKDSAESKTSAANA